MVAVTIEVLLLGRAESGYFLAAICLFPELATVLVVGLCSQDLRRAMARCAPLSQRFRTLGDWIIAYLESCARLSIDFTVIFVMNHEIAHVTPIFLRLRRALVFPIWYLSATPYRSTTQCLVAPLTNACRTLMLGLAQPANTLRAAARAVLAWHVMLFRAPGH